MGQQQLLLLVLSIVVVAIAVVVGIQAFQEGAEKAHRDAVVDETMRIVARLQTWKMKPEALGGGGETTASDYSSVTLEALGYPVSDPDGYYRTMNGCYALTGATDGATLSAYRIQPDRTCDPLARIGVVTVRGDQVKDIIWSFE